MVYGCGCNIYIKYKGGQDENSDYNSAKYIAC